MSELPNNQSAQPVALTDRQTEYLKGLVRSSLRKIVKGEASLRRKFGTNYRPEEKDAKIELAHATYRALGGDPDNISNLETCDAL